MNASRQQRWDTIHNDLVGGSRSYVACLVAAREPQHKKDGIMADAVPVKYGLSEANATFLENI